MRFDRDTNTRLLETQQQAKEDPAAVQPARREQRQEQFGVALRVLRRGEPLGAAVARAVARRRRGDRAHRRAGPPQPARRPALRR